MIDKIKENQTFQYTIGEFIEAQHLVRCSQNAFDGHQLYVVVLTFIPFAVAYVCSRTFSKDVSSGTIRFVLFRTDLLIGLLEKHWDN